MKKIFTLVVLLVLSSCLLGNSALAQKRAIMKYVVTETIDFTVYHNSNGNPGNGRLSFDDDLHPQIDGQVVSERLTVGATNEWGFWGSDTYLVSYLQKNQRVNSSLAYLSNLNVDDIVTIWGEIGNDQGSIPGAFNITSGATLLNTTFYTYNGTTYPNSKEYKITEAGTATIQLDGDWSGIRKITIQSQVRDEDYFDYDPGYEEYDMYDEFSENDPKKIYDQNANPVNDGKPYTSYTLSTEETGITLNGNAAQYIVLDDSKITANNRIAIDPSAGDWRFNYGLRAPEGTWANFSICNLREGDRVVFSYTGTPPVFSSVAGGTTAPTGPYNGSKAFADQYNDGVYDEGEDIYITSGAIPETDWQRGEGAIYREDHDGDNGDYQLYYTQPYVITEDGHLDIAIAPDTRIVKIKIYSDHQASMVDEYDADSYTAKFDITGELQAMEHIVPGGLEVHVGSNDASQHAHVVTSAHGPVSIVNGVNGYKLPGISLDANGNLQFEFDLAHNIPETGTFYKFMPLEDGKMTLKFQAASMNYYSYALDGDAVYYGDVSNYGDGNWQEQFDRPNEQTRAVTCPYYLVKVEARGKTTFTKIGDYFNGEEVTYAIPGNVKADETYYLYGGWNATDLSFNGSGQGQNNLEYLPYGSGNGGAQKACGVAKLLEVVFNPNKKIYPLAKWVPNGTIEVKTGSGVPNPDTFETEYELADLFGYNDRTSITVKKMTGNISACHPYLYEVVKNQHYKLMIDGITFDGSKDKGGTILIKIGDATKKASPVFALTIAYSGDPQFDGNSGAGTRGHIWDYSTSSLHGLEYEPRPITQPRPNVTGVYEPNAAIPIPYGHYFENYFDADISQYSSNDEVLEALPKSGTGLLYEEISGDASDWMFNYNLVNAGKLYDPLFTNKYDLEGDNADLIWNTEGMVLRTSANASVMFNEFTGADIHQSTKDPDRYVGILKGGEFRIPWLMPGDRVIIYMGTGKGAFNDQAVFNIRGAYDAVYNDIGETDDYVIGGSHWDGADGDNNYRGCYHFFAKGHNDGPADMVFKMTGGSMCKIYSIQIYRGDRIYTNEIEGDAFYQVTTENDNASKTNTWTLKYFGKDEQLANYSGRYYQMNDIPASTGKFASYPVLTNNTNEDDKVVSFSYTGTKGDIGTIRVRAKDMEKNLNFVADYAEHNVTIAYQEAQSYPYTWDFTDVNPYSGQDVANEWTVNNDKVQSSIPVDTHYNLALWDENGSMRLNSQTIDTNGQDNIFESNSEQSANQLWAKHGTGDEATGIVIPETQGLWFYMDNNDPENNGKMQITEEGLTLEAGENDWCNKVVVPDVPAGGAVYLRMKGSSTSTTPVKKYKFGTGDFTDIAEATNCRYYEANDNSGDYIVAIMNTGSKTNLTLALGGFVLKKMAVSTDFKTVNRLGWATESRDHVIDPSLTSELTGYPFEHYIVTDVDYPNRTVEVTTIGKKVGNNVLPVVMPIAQEDGQQAYIIRNMKMDNTIVDKDGKPEPGRVQILNNGFHLFVPDMHDYVTNRKDGLDNLLDLQDVEENLLRARLNGDLDQKYNGYGDNEYNYVMTTSTTNINTGANTDYEDVVFARVTSKGMKGGKNVGYLPIDCTEPAGAAANNMRIVFNSLVEPNDVGESFETHIEVPLEEVFESGAIYYNLNGQKIDGRPTEGGIYIMNGKKVVVK